MLSITCLCDFFFFKQKTAYEMRISDWSSDVCSSDLRSELGPRSIETGFHGLLTDFENRCRFGLTHFFDRSQNERLAKLPGKGRNCFPQECEFLTICDAVFNAGGRVGHRGEFVIRGAQV